MIATKLDAIISQLLPNVLADDELGNGRSFTPLHLRRLWALTCLHAGEYIDEAVLVEALQKHLPPRVFLVREVATA
jgi:hypothetical protein